MGIAYDGLIDLDESDSDMVHLLALDGRIGVLDGLDVGLAHTWDITGDHEGLYSTWWGDAKVQLNNRDEVLGTPIVSLGVMKGYVYHENADVHITSFPMIISVPMSETVTPYFIYRFENISADFIPSEWEEPRHGFFLGSEIELGSAGTFTPVLGVDVGFMNSLYGGEGDMMFVLNAGVSFNSPSK